MCRVFKKLVISILPMLFLMNISYGIQNDYKNSLLRVNLEKVGDNLYNVNLIMQQKFQEPVKIIKKSDLNYYILLPETKNSITNIASNSKEIRNISLKAYKYEGAKANNGYVKVNIQTTKPMYFNIYTKSIQEAKIKENKDTVASNKTNDIKEPKMDEPKKVEKKNSNFQKEKILDSSNQKETPKKEKILNNPQNVDDSDDLIDYSLKQMNDDKNLNKTTKDIEEENIEDTKEVKDILVQEQFLNQDYEKYNPDENNNTQSEEYVEKNMDELLKLASRGKESSKLLKDNLMDNVSSHKANFGEIFFTILVGLISFYIVFIILLTKQKSVKLKKKKDLLSKNSSPFVPRDDKKKNNGDYFVFDSHIIQNGLTEPTDNNKEPKKYELSSYEPELKKDYPNSKLQETLSEYDVIQKALKEEAKREYIIQEHENNETVKNNNPVKYDNRIDTYNQNLKSAEFINKTQNNKPQNEQVKKVQIKPIKETNSNNEPVVLSKVDIAPQRGFMCISYNDNVNLVGFIFDDVFPLYNFKKTKLDNYDIKYRIIDKTSSTVHFIVKIDRMKFLISVLSDSMKFEIML